MLTLGERVTRAWQPSAAGHRRGAALLRSTSVGWPMSASQPFSTLYIAGEVKIGSTGGVSSAG